jgi:hypothetical protein
LGIGVYGGEYLKYLIPTVVVLASIKKRSNCSVKELKASRRLFWSAGGLLQKLHTSSSPPTLLALWSQLTSQEFANFLLGTRTPSHLSKAFLNRVIVIEQPNDFSKLTIEEVQNAKIVLVSWGTTTKVTYIKKLANLAGIMEPGSHLRSLSLRVLD